MKTKCIYLDIDGVLTDFVGAVLELYGRPESDRNLVRSWDGIPAVVDTNNLCMWERIAGEGQVWWATLPWTEHGEAIAEICERAGPFVLMSTPTREPSCAAGKIEWINQYFPSSDRRFALTPCKHHFAHPGALLIDDSERNVRAFRENGGEAILWPAPWNAWGREPEEADLEWLRNLTR